VISQKKSWEIKRVANSAHKYLSRLDIKTQENILIKMERLEYDPYVGNIKKVEGKKDIYRLRVDDYRIYYRLQPRIQTIEILLINHKSGIKDKAIQRL
jgi:mRNA-degrading endonuclease RelE of RelBE toxin-antitoxin system